MEEFEPRVKRSESLKVEGRRSKVEGRRSKVEGRVGLSSFDVQCLAFDVRCSKEGSVGVSPASWEEREEFTEKIAKNTKEEKGIETAMPGER
jgi:hypothetical protein